MTRAAQVQGGLLLALLGLTGWLLAWHAPPWPQPPVARVGTAGAAVLAWLVTIPALRRCLPGARRRHAGIAFDSARTTSREETWWVLCASQSGVADALAAHTVAVLGRAGVATRQLDLGACNGPRLAMLRRVLFVVSTTGDGDAPDSAAGFVSSVMRGPATLRGLRYGVLALGDSEYDDFCGFGRALDRWLTASGATRAFDTVEVDDEDPAALQQWSHRVAAWSGAATTATWEAQPFQRWRLVWRHQLNPGSLGGACFQLGLQGASQRPLSWQPGDVAEVCPRHDPRTVEAFLDATGLDGDRITDTDAGAEPLRQLLASRRLPPPRDVRTTAVADWVHGLQALPARSYSIASTPAEGTLQLMVRRMQHPDGRPGLASHWLTAVAGLGSGIDLRIRANPHFRAPDDDRPLLLIGNGTGMAGLRALLRARVEAGHHQNWLLFGERQRAVDAFHHHELATWRKQGLLPRLDLAFSRDQAARVYVQHVLARCASRVVAFLGDRSAIRVCGSLAMGQAVDTELAGMLGRAALQRMAADGRYGRDVY